MSKFQIQSRKWNVAIGIGVFVLFLGAFGSLFFLQALIAPGTPTYVFLVILGVVTALLFALPGLVYPARKRVGPVKKVLPGGTMAWVRSHLYIPILSLAAAYVHASSAPFQGQLTTGKVTLVLGILVMVSGYARHHMIGLQKEAININVEINKLTIDQPREFRRLVLDFTQNRRPLEEIDADAAKLDDARAVLWREIRKLEGQIDRFFPREGGQSRLVLHLTMWRKLHPWLTVGLFVVLGYHVFDVVGGHQSVFGDEKTEFASAEACGSCHGDLFREWATSAMSHAQTGTVMEAQLPVTLNENRKLAEERGEEQAKLLDGLGKVCINCHAQAGARFADELALLPFNQAGSDPDGGVAVSGGGDAVQRDGVGCVVCHSQKTTLPEMAAAGELPIDNGGAADFGTQFGPRFDDPLPVRVHGIETSGAWSSPVRSSLACGSCHNVKADLDGDGLTPIADASEDVLSDEGRTDLDGDRQLDQNELDNEDGSLDDLVLQTTFDEWQDYLVAFETRYADDPRQTLDGPISCAECHMPRKGDGTQGAVDYAPGLLSVKERGHRSHAFVGVDYDLDPSAYDDAGGDEAFAEVLAERQALLQSAVTIEVGRGEVADGRLTAPVTVRNNLLGHTFPTGFAFARQLWLEVQAETAGGEEVCLVAPNPALPAPCRSGVVDDFDDSLPQCDVAAVSEAIAADPTLLGTQVDPAALGNADVRFADALAPGECDPWLTNWQKILTDGDADGDAVFEEVPYQSFLPDIVKLRVRVATQQPMRVLETVRANVDPATGAVTELDADTYNYVFDVSGVPEGEEVVVTARLRFRHLPPEFLTSLDARLDDLDDIPVSARLDLESALGNLVITDVLERRTGQGADPECEGPQNGDDKSILDCVDADDLKVALAQVERMRDLRDVDRSSGEGALAAGAGATPGMVFVGSILVAATAGLLPELRRRGRRSRA